MHMIIRLRSQFHYRFCGKINRIDKTGFIQPMNEGINRSVETPLNESRSCKSLAPPRYILKRPSDDFHFNSITIPKRGSIEHCDMRYREKDNPKYREISESIDYTTNNTHHKTYKLHRKNLNSISGYRIKMKKLSYNSHQLQSLHNEVLVSKINPRMKRRSINLDPSIVRSNKHMKNAFVLENKREEIRNPKVKIILPIILKKRNKIQ